MLESIIRPVSLVSSAPLTLVGTKQLDTLISACNYAVQVYRYWCVAVVAKFAPREMYLWRNGVAGNGPMLAARTRWQRAT
jgi:hypothetical protein